MYELTAVVIDPPKYQAVRSVGLEDRLRNGAINRHLTDTVRARFTGLELTLLLAELLSKQ